MRRMSSDAPSTSRGRTVRRITVVVLLLLVAASIVAFAVRATSSNDQATVRTDPEAVEQTTVEQYPVESVAADRRLVQTAVLPRGDLAGRPLLVLLTGKGQDPTVIAGDHLRSAVARLGDRAPVVVLPANDGGSFWHDRRSGRWRGYVLEEAIPAALERYGLDAERVAIGGISMGGTGAFSIAARADRPFCAVGGHSAAFWPTLDQAMPGAYDDEQAFRANEPAGPIVRGEQRYGVPLYVDVGRSDPFAADNARVVAALRDNGEQVTAPTPEGDHDGRYWRDHMADWMRFYGNALANCD